MSKIRSVLQLFIYSLLVTLILSLCCFLLHFHVLISKDQIISQSRIKHVVVYDYEKCYLQF